MAVLTTEGVSGVSINVDTVDGVVTLHGKVGSAAEKEKAGSAVRNLAGVKQVRNLLQVVEQRRKEQVEASDGEIKDRVNRALRSDAALSAVSVQSVNAGVVLLKGEVEGLSSHLRAIEVASRVPGVRRVVSEIKSPYKLADTEIYAERKGSGASKRGSAVSDMWITSAVKFRLMADDRTPGLDVNVDTWDGKVTLFGIVDSEQAKAAAERDARKVSGVKAVVNELEVVPSARQQAVKADDEQVEQHVKDALRRPAELRDASIDVEVRNGVARLTGTVPSGAERIRAAVIARTTAGVKAVRDDLCVAAR